MTFKTKVLSIWHPGKRVDDKGNPHQEDYLCPSSTEGGVADGCNTFVLCDGMGGHEAGEVASRTVCETIDAVIKAKGCDTTGRFTDTDLSEAIEAAYKELDKYDSTAGNKMGTTLTFLKLHSGGATIAHIGDSRVYHIRPGQDAASTQILYQSEDHSLVNAMVKSGQITREEAHTSPYKNVITRAMQPGIDSRCKATVYHTADILPGDYFYLCSDGMLERDEMDNGSRLKEIFSPLIATDAERVAVLTAETADNSDNHSAFIIRVEDVEGTQPAAAPEPRSAPTPEPSIADQARALLSRINSLLPQVNPMLLVVAIALIIGLLFFLIVK